MNYWLIKSEPDVFGLDDLKKAPGQKTAWEGVRNYQARNYMRDDMRVGDLAFFYHSNAKPPGIAGIAEVVSKPYADPSQFLSNNHYFDADSKPDAPRWLLVDFRYKQHLSRFLPLQELKEQLELDGMVLLRKGSRLSISPVEKRHWDYIVHLSNRASAVLPETGTATRKR